MDNLQASLAKELQGLSAAIKELQAQIAAPASSTLAEPTVEAAWTRRARRYGPRYAPLIALVAAQSLLLLLTPAADRTASTGSGFGQGSGFESAAVAGEEGFVGATEGGITDAGPAAVAGGMSGTTGTGGGPTRPRAGGAAGTAGPAASEADGGAADAASGPAATAAAGAQGALAMGGKSAGLDPRQPEYWPWTKPWLLQGDRSKCAPGGQLQETVRDTLIPCVPKYTGNNGGNTWKGVTKDTINVVWYQNYRDASGDAFYEGVLEQSREQEEQHVAAFTKYFNDHFEFYGRKIKMTFVRGTCTAADCWRNEARTLVQKHEPLAVLSYANGVDMADELAKLGVWWTSPTHGRPDQSFYTSRRPFIWGPYADGQYTSQMTADYFCKKLYGKNATAAGDASMHLKRRKLGIVSRAAPEFDDVTNYIVKLVTGGMCGTADERDKPVVFRAETGDAARAQEQAKVLAATFKQEGVTTTYSVVGSGGELAAYTSENYYPEILVSFSTFDHDLVTRPGNPDQTRNMFGFGVLKGYRPNDQEEFTKVAKAANPNFDFRCSGCLAHWNTFLPLMYQLQWAGPNLTPYTMERGAHEMPQAGGFRWSDNNNESPWPGWKCCVPYAIKHDFYGGKPGAYTVVKDGRHVYYDPSARSTYDNAPGTWVCPEGPQCPRFDLGGWSPGEPKQPDANAPKG